MKKIGILQFPGSNYDRDVFQALKRRGADTPFWPAATAAGKEEQGLQDRLGKRVFLSVSEKIPEAQIKGLTVVAKRLTRLPTT